MSNKYTDEDLLNLLRTFHAEHGRSPKQREIVQYQTITKRFGSWNKALEKAGLTVLRENYSDEYLLNLLKDFYKKHGRSPKRREIKENNAIRERFCSWNNALEKAGLPVLRKIWTKEELIKVVDDIILEHGRPLSAEEINQDTSLFNTSTFRKIVGIPYTKYIEALGFEPNIKLCDKKYLIMDDKQILQEFKKELERIQTNRWRIFNQKRRNGFPNESYFRKRFNCSWNELLQIINIDTSVKRLSKEEFVNWYLNLIKEKDYTPSQSELNNQYSFFNFHMKKYFKNYSNMCKELNVKQPAKTPDIVTETDEELLDMYIRFSENLGRPATSKELDASDEIYNADVFVLRFGGMNELKRLCGYHEYVTKSRKRYSKQEIKLKLIRYYKENGNKRLTNNELNKLIPLSTVKRYFQTTKISVVWEIIEKELSTEDTSE